MDRSHFASEQQRMVDALQGSRVTDDTPGKAR